jgi:hypothetical protein
MWAIVFNLSMGTLQSIKFVVVRVERITLKPNRPMVGGVEERVTRMLPAFAAMIHRSNELCCRFRLAESNAFVITPLLLFQPLTI